MTDRATWTPPLPLVSAEGRVKGTLGGSLLWDRPEHQAERERVLSFLAAPGPVWLEIGFDHGMGILDRARRWPDTRQLGVELRKRRVAGVAAHAPENCLLLATDARGLLSRVLPPGRLDLTLILFPTPALDPRHLLLTEGLVAELARVTAPGGRVHLATDVPAYADWICGLFSGWAEAEAPELGPVLSRRERVCRRDDLPVWRMTYRRSG